MRVAIYKLSFPHGIHVGAHGMGTESVLTTIPADTLFSALLSTWINSGNDPEHWISQFPHTEREEHIPADPPFLLTSAFPYSESVLLFPKPADPKLALTLSDTDRKKWKKLSFISESVAIALTKSRSLAEFVVANGILNSQMLFSKAEAKSMPKDKEIWHEKRVPRVTIDRLTSSSNLFQVGKVNFAKDSGLWFGVIWRDPKRPCGDVPFEEAFEAAFKALSLSGIGGERSVGYGMFEYELMDTFEWPDPEPGKPALLLSRYLPHPDELPNVLRGAKGYRFEEVRGWTTSPYGQYRRRSIVMLKEGSVLVPERDIMGHVVDVGPIDINTGQPLLPHPVWRYGLAALYPLGGGG